jgi:UDP-N-acetyl-D-glucosamine dehydrogenase
MKKLIEKIKKRKAIIGIIGLGYVGLPLVIRFAEEEFTVIGFDIDESKVKKINTGKSYIKHIPDIELKKHTKYGHIKATTAWLEPLQ